MRMGVRYGHLMVDKATATQALKGLEIDLYGGMVNLKAARQDVALALEFLEQPEAPSVSVADLETVEATLLQAIHLLPSFPRRAAEFAQRAKNRLHHLIEDAEADRN